VPTAALDIEQFIANGFVVLRDALPAATVAACSDVIWERLRARGVDRDDRSTWQAPVVRFDCPEGGPFVDAGTAAVLHEAYDVLLGPGRWKPRRGVGGTIAARFPSDGDPGDAGWHVDGSYDGDDGAYWVNVHSKQRGLLALFLFSDVDPADAPTRILVGSHLDVPAVLQPLAEHGTRFGKVAQLLPRSTYDRDIAHAIGRAGDVYLCHPFLVHAATWPHRGSRARLIAQPGVATHEPFALAEGAAACPVEAAILRGLAHR
jgi:hypothetical protein